MESPMRGAPAGKGQGAGPLRAGGEWETAGGGARGGKGGPPGKGAAAMLPRRAFAFAALAFFVAF